MQLTENLTFISVEKDFTTIRTQNTLCSQLSSGTVPRYKKKLPHKQNSHSLNQGHPKNVENLE